MPYYIFYNNITEVYEVRNTINNRGVSYHPNIAGAKNKLDYLTKQEKEINHKKTVEDYFINRDRQK